MTVYLAEDKRGTVYWGQKTPIGQAGDVWVTWVKIDPVSPGGWPQLRQVVNVWDDGWKELTEAR